MTLADAIALATLGFTVLVAGVGATWGIGRVRDAVRDELSVSEQRIEAKIEDIERTLAGKVEDVERTSNSRIEGLRHEVGEGISAVRQKIHEVELWGRDNYVKQKQYDAFITLLTQNLRMEFQKLEDRFNRVEDKLDKKLAI